MVELLKLHHKPGHSIKDIFHHLNV